MVMSKYAFPFRNLFDRTYKIYDRYSVGNARWCGETWPSGIHYNCHCTCMNACRIKSILPSTMKITSDRCWHLSPSVCIKIIMDEAAIHITWALFSIIAVIFITIAWTVIAKTPSRKNGIHAFVASLLTSRAIYCLSVTLLLVAYYFAAVNWSILACHALYWLWTVSWSSDLLAAVAAMGWGLRKIQYPTSAFRLGSTVAIAGMWLIATTIAGIMTYFNQGIKSNDYLSNVGCSVVPNPEELSLAITLFVFQWTGVALTVSMLLSFIIKFQISAKTHNKESEKTKTCSLVAKGLGATNGEECLHSVPITKEPGRLEAIEDRQKRRKLTGGGTVHLSELDLEQLTSWRIVYCIIECLLLLLNLTPHMVSPIPCLLSNLYPKCLKVS